MTIKSLCKSTLLVTVVLAAGCADDFVWPGTGDICPTTEFLDSWDVTCGCARVVGDRIDATTGTVRACGLDHDSDGLLATLKLAEECRKLATTLTLRTGAPAWECEATSHMRVSRSDCADDTTTRCDEEDVAGAAEPLVGWSNTQATFIGNLDPSRSYVRLRIGEHEISPDLSGQIYVAGGRCPGESCSITVDGLFVRAADFSIAGRPVRDVDIVNVGLWPGHKRADNRYSFGRGALLKLAGEVAGDRGFALGFPRGDIGGAFYDEIAPLPGGGPPDSRRYMTIEGRYDFTEGTAEFFLVFPFGNGAPRPRVSAHWVSCTVYSPGDCGWVFSAEESRAFDGSPVTRYRWYDAQGRLVGTEGRIKASSIYEVPGEPSRWPLRVVVTDSQGRSDSATTGAKEETSRKPTPKLGDNSKLKPRSLLPPRTLRKYLIPRMK